MGFTAKLLKRSIICGVTFRTALLLSRVTIFACITNSVVPSQMYSAAFQSHIDSLQVTLHQFNAEYYCLYYM